MPQENNPSQRSEFTRSESSRSERVRSERSLASGMNAPLGEMGVRSVSAGLRLQKEMYDVFQDIGREWFARATSGAELCFKHPNKLSAARSVSDALSGYQEWLGECMNMLGEESRHFISNGQKILDTGVRAFSEASPSAAS